MSGKLLRPRCVIVVGLIVLNATNARANEPSADDIALVERALRDFRAHREELRSGAFHAVGKTEDDTLPKVKSARINGALRIFSAFDHPSQRLRFDVEEPRLVVKSEGGETPTLDPAQMKWEIEPLRKKYILTPDDTWLWRSDNTGVVNVGDVDAKTEPGTKAFDVRVIGCSPLYVLRRNMPLEKVCESFGKFTLAEVKKEPDNRIRIRWVGLKPEQGDRTLWLDSGRSFVPTRLECRTSIPATNGSSGFEASILSATNWERINGIWVPKSFFVEEKNGPTRRRWTLSFEWDNVNGTVDDSLFTPEGLDIPNSVRVVDEGAGRPVVIKTIRNPGPKPRSNNR